MLLKLIHKTSAPIAIALLLLSTPSACILWLLLSSSYFIYNRKAWIAEETLVITLIFWYGLFTTPFFDEAELKMIVIGFEKTQRALEIAATSPLPLQNICFETVEFFDYLSNLLGIYIRIPCLFGIIFGLAKLLAELIFGQSMDPESDKGKKKPAEPASDQPKPRPTKKPWWNRPEREESSEHPFLDIARQMQEQERKSGSKSQSQKRVRSKEEWQKHVFEAIEKAERKRGKAGSKSQSQKPADDEKKP